MTGERSPYFWTLTGPRRADGQPMTPDDEDAAFGEFEVVTGEQSPFGPSGIAGGPLTEVKPRNPVLELRARVKLRWTLGDCKAALEACDGNPDACIDWLKRAKPGTGPQASTAPMTDAEHAEAHAELREARKAVDDESDARALELGWHLHRDARAFVGEL